LIFIDANIPMYLVGAAHPNKVAAQVQVSALAASGERLVTDAEVLQEFLHRFSAIRRLEAIADTLALTLAIVDEVFSVTRNDVLRAAEVLQSPSGLSARDALHIAVMERHGIRQILTFDAAFDRWPGLVRVPLG